MAQLLSNIVGLPGNANPGFGKTTGNTRELHKIVENVHLSDVMAAGLTKMINPMKHNPGTGTDQSYQVRGDDVAAAVCHEILWKKLGDSAARQCQGLGTISRLTETITRGAYYGLEPYLKAKSRAMSKYFSILF